MKKIEKDGITYAILGNVNQAEQGWQFHDDKESPLQWGLGLFQAGEDLLPHFHKVRKRIPAHKTKEFIYVVRGVVQIDFYDNNKIFCSELMPMGAFVYLIDGTHGFQVVMDNTCLIEIKNGPFAITELDKERILTKHNM